MNDSDRMDRLLKSIEDNNADEEAAAACRSLSSLFPGTESERRAIVEINGVERLINLALRFADRPLLLKEVMWTISVLCALSPKNAKRAIKAGAATLVTAAMRTLPDDAETQIIGSQMIRNIGLGNQNNREVLLINGVESLIRTAMANHETCRDFAIDALRELGFDI